MNTHTALPTLTLLATLAASAHAAPLAGLDANGHLLPVAAATSAFSYAPIAHGVQVRVGGVTKNVIFYGPATEHMEEINVRTPPVDLRWAEKIPAFLLLLVLFFIGIWPKSISSPIHDALEFAKRTPSAVATGVSDVKTPAAPQQAPVSSPR